MRGVQVERQPGPLATAGALLVSLIVVAPLAFLSPELALLGLGVTALAFFVLLDHRHRAFWELAANNKFRILAAQQKNMDRALSRMRTELTDIRDTLAARTTTQNMPRNTSQNTTKSTADQQVEEPPVELVDRLDQPKPSAEPPLKAVLKQLTPDANPMPETSAPVKAQTGETHSLNRAPSSAPKPAPSARAKDVTKAKDLSKVLPAAANDPIPSIPDITAPSPSDTVKQDAKPDTPAPQHATKPGDETDDFDALSDLVVKELIHQAVRNERVDVFIQPVMRLPQRRVRFYEMFARVRARPGLYVPAQRYMALAEQDKLMGDIDTLSLLECLRTLKSTAHLQRPAPIFLNITMATLQNGFFMKHLLTFLAKNKALAPRLVFEIPKKDYDALSPPLLEVIKGLGTLGCALSLDHVDSLDLDIGDLLRFKVRFVKVDAALLSSAAQSDGDFAEMQRLKRRIEGNGIAVIAEKIEDETTLMDVLDYGIHYGQGYLFGKPGLQGAYKPKKVA